VDDLSNLKLDVYELSIEIEDPKNQKHISDLIIIVKGENGESDPDIFISLKDASSAN